MAHEASNLSFSPGFRVNPRQYTLTRDGRIVDLPRIPMDILLLLLSKRGELVTRAEIAEAVWPGSSVDEVMYRINTAITRIRRTLGDDPDEPRHVETVIGRGYRFIAPVEVEALDAASESLPSGTLLPDSSTSGWAETTDPVAESYAAPPSLALDSMSSPGSRPATRWKSWAGAGLAAAAAVALGGYLLRSSPPSAAIIWPTPVRLTGNNSDNPVETAAISPDGQRLAFADHDGVSIKGRSDLTATPLAGLPLSKIYRISWFPDGTRLAVSGIARNSSAPQLWMLAASGTVQPFLLREGARNAAVSSRTGQIAYLNADATEIWQQEDNKPLHLLRTATVGTTFSDLTWLQNGAVLLANEIRGVGLRSAAQNTELISPARSTLLAVEAGTGSILASQASVRLLEGCSFPDGHLLLEGLDEQKRPVELSESVSARARGFRFASPVVAEFPKGHLRSCSAAIATGEVAALAQNGQPVIYVADLSADDRALLRARPITSTERESYPHAWTPDSQSVLFEQVSNDVWYLLRQDLNHHDPQPLLSPRLPGVMPRYSPDGRWILFYRKDGEGVPRLFHMLADGQNGPPAQLAVPPGELRCPRGGATCVLRVLDTMTHKVILYALDPASGGTKVLRVLAWDEAASADWDVAPDGKSVVMCGSPDTNGVLRVFPLSASGETSLTFHVDGGALRAVNWAASGDGWFGVTYTDTGSNLYFLEPGGSATLIRSLTTTTWAVPSPNGHNLAFVDLYQDKNVWLIPGDGHGRT